MNQQVCDPDRLSSFVRGELNAQEELALTAHLDECDSCGKALEFQIAEESAWGEARVFLGDDLSYECDGDFTIGETLDSQIQQVLSQLHPTEMPESLGRIGVYEVTGVIGSGGMGVVLKARDTSLDRIVAVKVMAPHLAASGSARQRFAREAKAAAAVLHPNVIAIHGVANDFTLPYLVMPYVSGGSLQKRLGAHGPLPLLDILRIGSQVAAGLAAAHEQGLVHRDIKPGNILLEQGVERVTITDFGLARAVDDASMTRSGVIAGTPQYMSPEQARGERVDHRSDLFSLGSVLYAMCTGHAPFRAESSYSVLRLITDKEPRSIREVNPDIPEWLCTIIGKLMAKHADDRIESAEEIATLLENCLAHVQQPLEFELPMTPDQPTVSAVTTNLSTATKCLFSSPEHQRSLLGRLVWPFLDWGTVRLTESAIEWTLNSGLQQSVPLSCIEEVSIGHYSRWTHPLRMDYLSIRYRDGDSVETQLLSPVNSLLTPVTTINAAVRRWARQLPNFKDSTEPSPPRSTALRWLGVFTLGLFFALAGALIILETNKGTLRIESELDGVPIRIRQADKSVDAFSVSKAGKSTRIASGEYVIEIDQGFDQAVLRDNMVRISRGDTTVVRVTQVEPQATGIVNNPVRETTLNERQQVFTDLHSIVDAMHRYHDKHGHFPAASIRGKNGSSGPPHSWRVELLPLLGYQELYNQYYFDEPWDSQHNKSLLAKMPACYRSPLDKPNSTNAAYFGVVSNDVSPRATALQKMRDQRNGDLEPEYEKYVPEATVFWKERGASFRDMHDGTSHCIAIVEAQLDIPWTKPEDIEYSANKPLPTFGGWFDDGWHAAFADGSVKFLANYNDEKAIRNMLTITDGVSVTPLEVRRLHVREAIEIPRSSEQETFGGKKDYQVPDGPLLSIQNDQPPIFTEADVVDVASLAGNEFSADGVTMALTKEAGQRLRDITERLSEQRNNSYLAILLDGEVVSAPRVIAPIFNKLSITGDFDKQELADRIQAAVDEARNARGKAENTAKSARIRDSVGSLETQSGSDLATETEIDACDQLAAMQGWVIAWDNQLSKIDGRRLALVRVFPDGRFVAIHGIDAPLVQTRIDPAEVEKLVRLFAAKGTKRKVPVHNSAEIKRSSSEIGRQLSEDAKIGDPLPKYLENHIGDRLTVIHEGAYYDLMSFMSLVPDSDEPPQHEHVAEFSNDLRQQLMPLILRARLGGYDECLKFANAQLRARFPQTPVELKESDVHQIYQLGDDVIGVLFRFSVDGKPASFPSGILKVHRDEDGTWSVISGVYRRDENTSENWSGE